MRNNLKAKADGFPDKPGIYLFRNAAGDILYIGKARSLRDRVRSYFLADPDFKVRNILVETADIDVILTETEKDAAFLENNYIRRHQPKFNLRLKDDKSFPYLKLNLGEPFPGISLSRKVEEGGAKYFGPFSPAGRIRTTIRLVNKLFGLRSCRDSVFKRRKRPCLEHDLGLCSAPCAGMITESEYHEAAGNARLFLEGKTEDLLKKLKRRMKTAAGDQLYEEAARLRDAVRTIEDLKLKPRTVSVELEDLDAAGFARSGESAALHVFFMRRGKILDSGDAHASGLAGISNAEALGRLLSEFYGSHGKPALVLVPFEPGRKADLSRAGLDGPGAKARLRIPKTRRHARLVELAGKNAEMALHHKGPGTAPLLSLARILKMDHPPTRIEGFDISNTGGDESVGSLVVFDDAVPNKKEYRKFKIRTVRGSDDTASLEEVVGRRYARLRLEGHRLPDLVLVDGGKGQLQAALRALKRAGADRLPAVSLAKKEEIIFTTGVKAGLRLDRTSPALKLLQGVRDEAHRFAVSFHRTRREKKSFK